MGDAPPPARVLVRAPNWVGDVVMATPALRALRAALPAARIALLGRPLVERILSGTPWVDEFLPAPRGLSWPATLWALRGRRFDLAVALPNSWRAALETFASGAPRRVGYRRGGRGLFLTHALSRPTDDRGRFAPVYMGEYYLRLLRLIGIDGQPRVELPLPDQLRARGEALLHGFGITSGDRLICLNPGAAYGSSKCWLPERFAQVADRCARELGAKVALLSGPGEGDVVSAILGRMTSRLVNDPRAVIPLDLLRPVIRRANLLITNDTGPRHYAAAFDVPAVVIMGSTDPRYTQCPGERAVILREAHLPCIACHRRVCPLPDHPCMAGITVDRVMAAARGALEKGGRELVRCRDCRDAPEP
ncbi:MAG: lipopolysaccharide heptosyltransferase II [Planctomycetes bacterium]|nr:lipopolysaccharide heptosyltransferase II [Planctomycetota bacterium]